MAGNEAALWTLSLPTSKGASEELFQASTLLIDSKSSTANGYALQNYGTSSSQIRNGSNDFCRWEDDGFYATGNGYLQSNMSAQMTLDKGDQLRFSVQFDLDDIMVGDHGIFSLTSDAGDWIFALESGFFTAITPTDGTKYTSDNNCSGLSGKQTFQFRINPLTSTIGIARLGGLSDDPLSGEWDNFTSITHGGPLGTGAMNNLELKVATDGTNNMTGKMHWWGIWNMDRNITLYMDFSKVHTVGTSAFAGFDTGASVYQEMQIVDSAPNNTRAKYLEKKMNNYVYDFGAGPGKYAISGNIAPENALVFSTGSVEVRAEIAIEGANALTADDTAIELLNTSALSIVAKKAVADGFDFITTWNGGGTTVTCNVPLNVFCDGQVLDISIRSSGSSVEVWYKPENATAWLIGGSQANAIVPQNIDGEIKIGASPLAMRIYKLNIYDGVGGNLLLMVDLNRARYLLGTDKAFPALRGVEDQILNIDKMNYPRILVEDPSWLFDAGKFIECVDAGGSLSLDTSMTILMAHRRHVAYTDGGAMAKKMLLAGWNMTEMLSGGFDVTITDGANTESAQSAADTDDHITLSAFSFDSVNKVLSLYVDGKDKVTKSVSSINSLQDATSLMIGDKDMELFSFIAIPEVLTDEQIENISDYYLGNSFAPNNLEYGFWLVSVGSETFV
jgi:hypothetical protein